MNFDGDEFTFPNKSLVSIACGLTPIAFENTKVPTELLVASIKWEVKVRFIYKTGTVTVELHKNFKVSCSIHRGLWQFLIIRVSFFLSLILSPSL